MSKAKKHSSQSATSPINLPWMMSPPLLPGEDPAEYERLKAHVSTAIKPTNVIEQIWVDDLVYWTWEIHRWRRLKADFVNSTRHSGLSKLLENKFSKYEAADVAKNWALNDPEAIKIVNEFLASANLTMDAVIAQTFAANLNSIERMEQMLARAEARRNATLREIERYRTELAARAKRALEQIDVAGSAKISPKQTPLNVAGPVVEHDERP